MVKLNPKFADLDLWIEALEVVYFIEDVVERLWVDLGEGGNVALNLAILRVFE